MMETAKTSSRSEARGRCRLGAWLLAGLALLGLPQALQAVPTVNGLFYGDGDYLEYQAYATSIGGSVLYSYLDAPTTTLYVALVVSHQVNDLVCEKKGNGPSANLYQKSADAGDPIYWNGHRSCKRASDSEFAQFTLECAPGSPRSWAWQQALGCATVAGPPQSSWVSAETCASSAPTWPPSIVATTSWVANVNAYQANPAPAWNMYVAGNDVGDWKSPFLASNPNDVTIVPGYPTYSAAHEWEWSMVYEWSVNLGPAGANCGGNAIYFVTGESHHSPPKSGPESDTFPPPLDPPILSDWGDLPDTFGTTSAAGGPQHYLTVTGPYLGLDLQNEADGSPTADASGDGAEEDGLTITLTADWVPGTTQSITVEVGNAPGGAVLAGWFDWNGDGDFVGDPNEFFTWPVVEGTNSLDVLVGAGFDWSTDELPVRLRVFSSAAAAPGGTLDAADYGGIATDGEVEDYNFPVGALPVTLNAFSSSAGGGRLTVSWQTATETDNVGFEVLGRVDGKWRPLGEFVPSRGMNSALPQEYEVTFTPPTALQAIELVDYDTRGRPERFGPFRPGVAYGEKQRASRIDWSGPRAAREERLARRGFTETGKLRRGGIGEGASARSRWRRLETARTGRGARRAATNGASTHVAVTEPGIQRVSYEALRAGGLDLAGVRKHDIAVSWRGDPVARRVESRGPFGPGGYFEFVGRPPIGDDALYIDASLYQVSVDPDLALPSRHVGQGRASGVSQAYRREAKVDLPVLYHRQSPTGDPWVARTVLVRGRTTTVTLDLPVDGPVLPGPSQLVVGLGAVSDLPDLLGPGGEVLPEHNVEIWLSGPSSSFAYLGSASASGQRDWRIEAEIPEGLLEPGLNRLRLRFDSAYFFSLVLIDSYGVRYPAPYLGPALDFERDADAGGYWIDGFSRSSVAAYAEGVDGSLTRVDTLVRPSANGFGAHLRQVRDAARYWVSESPHLPSVFTTEAPEDRLDVPADLVVITDSSFIGTRALDDYLEQNSALHPVVVDVEAIYNRFGFGMALPGAITDYLRARDQAQPFTHVQLVGTDCYDRLNRLSDCVSFIPLPSAPVGVTRFSPSQNRLVDLDADGVGDKAVGQFSVRDEAELETIVRKGETWASGRLSSPETALLIAEETDGIHSFTAQVDRVRRRLRWSDAEVLDMADHPDIATARAALRDSLDKGRTLTVFSGHSSPNVWAFRSLLTGDGVAELTNFDAPTVMVPLACETTYDISPDADVLGHQLLFAGDQGALAISGAVALSNLDENERMATLVLDGLKSGMTLGAAVQAGREALGPVFRTLLDNWMTQGDVAARITY